MHLLRTRDAIARRGRRRRSISARRRPTSCSCPSPTAISAAFAAAWERERTGAPSLRVASLAQLQAPLFGRSLSSSGVAARARFVLVRLLGGHGLLALRRRGTCRRRARARLPSRCRAGRLPGGCAAGRGVDAAGRGSAPALALVPPGRPRQPSALPRLIATRIGAPGGLARARTRAGHDGLSRTPAASAPEDAPRALLVFYRSVLMAADTAPIARAGGRHGGARPAVDGRLREQPEGSRRRRGLAALIADWRPDIDPEHHRLLGRAGEGPGVLDAADCPVLQVMLAGSTEDAWRGTDRGLARRGPRDERRAAGDRRPDRHPRHLLQGRERTARRAGIHAAWRTGPLPSRVAYVADLAAAWTRSAAQAARRAAHRLRALEYPDKGGRAGYAVGSIHRRASLRSLRHLHEAGRGLCDCASRCRPCRRLHAADRRTVPPRAGGARDATHRSLDVMPLFAAGRPEPPSARYGDRVAGRDPSGRSLATDETAHLPLPIVIRTGPRRHPARRASQPDRGIARCAPQERLPRPEPAAAPRLRRVLSLAAARGAHPRDHPLRHARHARMAAGQGCRARRSLRAGSGARPRAGHLSLHRQQSRRGRAGQAPARRRHHRPSDAAAE